MKRLAISLALLAAVAGLAAWWFSDTQVLKRRTHSLLTTLTIDSGNGKVGRQMGAYTLNSLLAEQIELANPTLEEADGSFERSELEAAYSWLCNQSKETLFEMRKIHSITVNGTDGNVSLTLVGLVELPTYRPVDGTFDVVLDWKKHEDGWRLTRATWKPVP